MNSISERTNTVSGNLCLKERTMCRGNHIFTGMMMAFAVALVLLFMCSTSEAGKPRVFVIHDAQLPPSGEKTETNDRNSLLHLLWYADELDIKGIYPQLFGAGGPEATEMVISAYETDYNASGTKFVEMGYPTPNAIRNLVAESDSDGRQRLINAAKNASSSDPLYVVTWGPIRPLGETLQQDPTIVGNIRVLSTGTGLQPDHLGGDGIKRWANADGRDLIAGDSRFDDMWWIETEWNVMAYSAVNGTPKLDDFLDTLSANYGAMGAHADEISLDDQWSPPYKFKHCDSMTVYYLLDPNHNLDDPTEWSWGGVYTKQQASKRANYWIDTVGPYTWDFDNPVNTWSNAQDVYDYRVDTVRNHRSTIFGAMTDKLDVLYGYTAGDTTAPANPSGLSATANGSYQIDLDWNNNSESDLDSYKVYRSTSNGFSIGSGTLVASDVGSSAYTDGGLSSSTTYYYKVTAVDTSGNESGASSQASATTDTATGGSFAESNGMVVMEAENNTALFGGTGSADGLYWAEVTSFSDSSGGSAIQAQPNNGVNVGDSTDGPQADFNVDFSTTGTYYVWVRLYGLASGANDSLHAGLDGSPATYGSYGLQETVHDGTWQWINEVGGSAVTVSIPSAGTYTVNVWMREDGVLYDKVLLTTDSNYTPSAQGPAESGM